ncbi:hypothetical protein OFC62_43530, partial [Escherichia coli]|nr:hypothetical protein [Escherichia coli]
TTATGLNSAGSACPEVKSLLSTQWAPSVQQWQLVSGGSSRPSTPQAEQVNSLRDPPASGVSQAAGSAPALRQKST